MSISHQDSQFLTWFIVYVSTWHEVTVHSVSTLYTANNKTVAVFIFTITLAIVVL